MRSEWPIFYYFSARWLDKDWQASETVMPEAGVISAVF
jgi:hypothetical protein